jgi:hypothetical protein
MLAAGYELGSLLAPTLGRIRIWKRRFATWSAMPATANMVAKGTTQNRL